jgi:predicted dehydrogenase
MITAAIVGLGRWGRRLVEAVQEDGRPKGAFIHFNCAVTRTLATAEEFVRRQGLASTADLSDVLADPNLDAVVLATPHSQHADQIRMATAAGKHVFVEKPLTLSHESATACVADARGAGVVLAVGQNRRFLPAMHDLRAMIDEGDLGRVLHIDGNFSGAFGFNYQRGMWRAASTENPAGGMAAMGIHTLDAMIHLCGPIAEVQARSLRQVLDIELDDTTVALMCFANGMTGVLATLMATPRIWRLQVCGTRGWAHMRDHDVLDVCTAAGQVESQAYDPVDIERAELEAFAQAVLGEAPYPIPLEDSIHGIAVLEAIASSATQGAALVRVGS